MRAGWFLTTMVLVACGGQDDDLLAALDGTWAGAIDDPDASVPLVAEFEWRKGDELLFGTVTATLPAEPEPWVFAVRRWDTTGGVVYLDLTDETDATRGLDLDGTPDGKTFSGTATLTYDCPEGVCGFDGDVELDSE